MEFNEYGPLAQSKEMAANRKTSWVPLVVMLGLGVVIGVAWYNISQENQPCSNNKKS